MDVAIDDSGRTVLAGSGKNVNNLEQAWVARLLPNGKFDADFGNRGKVFGFGNAPSSAQRISQNRNSLFVWSTAIRSDSVVRFIRKLDDSGATSSEFAADVGGDRVTATGVPSDLLAFGQGVLGLTATGALFSIQKDGEVDSTFAPSVEASPVVIALDEQSRVLYGEVRASVFAVGRLLNSGALDSSFGLNGVVTVPFATGAKSNEFVSLFTGHDGNSFALVQSKTGTADTDTSVSVFAFTNTGAVNRDFGTSGTLVVPSTGGYATAYGAAVQSDGHLLVLYGEPDSHNLSVLPRLARYGVDGKLDATFAKAGVLDLSEVAASVTLRGMIYEPLSQRAVIYGSSADGGALFRVWL
jgi:hypothetical protein